MREFTRVTSVLLALGLCASTLPADEILANNGMTYSSVRIKSFIDGKVGYTIGNGQNLTKTLGEIRRVSISSIEALGQAEKLALKGDNWVEVITLYDAALAKAARQWQQTLIAARRLGALNAAGMSDRAIREWLALADGEKGAAWSLAAAPTKFSAKGSSANKIAISQLERKRASGKRSKAYDQKIGEVLLGFYGREGLTSKAAELADSLRGSGGAVKPVNGTGGTGTSPTTGGGSLASAEAYLNDDKPLKALEIIEEDVRSFLPSQLPKALLLRGLARVRVAQGRAGQAREEQLLQAGLDFMRVYSGFPSSTQAAEALFHAARVHTLFARPNLTVARAVYRKVVADYGRRGIASKAREALKKLGE